MKKEEAVLALSQKVERKYISVKQGDQYYVAWFDVVELLNERVGMGNWQWEVLDMKFETTANKSRCYLIGKLTIFCDDGELSMTSTGNEELNCSNYGDPSSNAEAMAMRRCASKFGLGLDLYRKSELAKLKKGTYTAETEQTAVIEAKPQKQLPQSTPRITNPNAKVIGYPKR